MPRKPTFTEDEMQKIADHIEPKFEALAKRVKFLEAGEEWEIKNKFTLLERKKVKGKWREIYDVEKDERTIIVGKAVTTVQINSRPIRLENLQQNELRRRLDAVRKSLERLGFDKEDAESSVGNLVGGEDTFVKKHLEWQKHYARFERGICAILRDFAPWFRNEMSAEKIPSISGNAKAKKIPVSIAAKIILILFDRDREKARKEKTQRRYPDCAVNFDHIENLMRDWWKKPSPLELPPLP